MTEDAAPFESHADDLARLCSSVNDLGCPSPQLLQHGAKASLAPAVAHAIISN
jgi:hypothetical protein